MGMFLADRRDPRDRVVVPPLEAVDHPGRDVDRSEHQGQGAGEVFAVARLAVDQEVFDRVEVGLLDLERILEFARVAEIPLEGRRLALDVPLGQVLDLFQRDGAELLPSRWGMAVSRFR